MVGFDLGVFIKNESWTFGGLGDTCGLGWVYFWVWNWICWAIINKRVRLLKLYHKDHLCKIPKVEGLKL